MTNPRIEEGNFYTFATVSSVAATAAQKGLWPNNKYEAMITLGGSNTVTMQFQVKHQESDAWADLLDSAGSADITLATAGTYRYEIEPNGADQVRVNVSVNGSSEDVDVILYPIYAQTVG